MPRPDRIVACGRVDRAYPAHPAHPARGQAPQAHGAGVHCNMHRQMHGRTQGRAGQRGAMLLAVVFFMVVAGFLAATMLSTLRNRSASTALDVQATRAYWAARSALEWGTYHVIDPLNSQGLGASALPACFASPRSLALPGDLAGFAVSLTCERFPATGAHEEGTHRVAGYRLVATASWGAAGTAERVERSIEARVTRCKNPNAAGPDHAC